MKKILLGIIAVVLIGLGVWKFAPKPIEVTSGKPVVKIGVILPLVGDYSEVGEIAKQAIMMFDKDGEARSLKNEYVFIVEGNDGWDLKSSANISRKMLSVDKVDAIISYWDASGQVVALTVKDKDVIHINLGASLKTIQYPNSFNLGPSSSSEAKASLAEMQKRGIKTLSLLASNDSWADDILAGYKEHASAFGIEIVSVDQAEIGTRDFRLTLRRIAEKKPDIISMFLEIPDFDIARKQMMELKIAIPVTSVQQTEYSPNPANFEGSWYVMFPDGTEGFHERFRQFSGLSNISNASIIYDIASLLVDAFEHSKSRDGALDYLQHLKSFFGASGDLHQVDRFFMTEDIIKGVKDGKLVVLEE